MLSLFALICLMHVSNDDFFHYPCPHCPGKDCASTNNRRLFTRLVSRWQSGTSQTRRQMLEQHDRASFCVKVKVNRTVYGVSTSVARSKREESHFLKLSPRDFARFGADAETCRCMHYLQLDLHPSTISQSDVNYDELLDDLFSSYWPKRVIVTMTDNEKKKVVSDSADGWMLTKVRTCMAFLRKCKTICHKVGFCAHHWRRYWKDRTGNAYQAQSSTFELRNPIVSAKYSAIKLLVACRRLLSTNVNHLLVVCVTDTDWRMIQFRQLPLGGAPIPES